MDDDRASIAEIRLAFGGHCDWVTRPMLKQAGSLLPGRQQIAGWAERPPAPERGVRYAGAYPVAV